MEGKGALIEAPVKSVSSAQITFWHGSGTCPQEKTLSLSCLQLPKCIQKFADLDEEPYGWESREYLRKLLVAEHVKVRREFTVGTQEFGSLFLMNGQNVSHLLLQLGLARVVPPSVPVSNLEELQEIEQFAQTAGVGIWDRSGQSGKHIRNIIFGWDEAERMRKFVEEHKGREVKGIIEEVKTGSIFAVYFPELQMMASVVLSGVLCDGDSVPGVRGTNPPPQSFSREAKSFAEIRLLQRDVDVLVEGLSSYSILGSVYRDGRNIATRILEMGLGKLDDMTAQLTKNPAELKSSVRTAQAKRQGRWKTLPDSTVTSSEYYARVLEIHSGDCVTVKPIDEDILDTENKRLYLASIRCPRSRTKNRDDEQFAYEAKEFLRNRLIGKKVKVKVEYIRDPTASPIPTAAPQASDASGKMHFVSLSLESGDQTIGILELLVSQGYARTVRHRSEDPTYSDYHTLQALEEEAASKKLGVHGVAKDAKITQVNEVLGVDKSERALSFESDLKRRGVLDAVVEYCFSCAMFKVRISSMMLAVKFHCGGILVPQCGRSPKDVDEPFAQEAVRFARENVMQRNVRIKIEACEKSGCFIGIMWLGKMCINVKLLEMGYGTVISGTLTRAKTSIRKDLMAAEKSAKEAKLGVWSLPEMQASDELNGDTVVVCEDIPSVQVAHTNRISQFYLQVHPNNELDRMQEELRQSFDDQMDRFTFATVPKLNDVVIAKYSVDGEWYRAAILKSDLETREAYVRFVDYGNEDFVDLDDLRRCRGEFQLAAFAPQAFLCRLAGLKYSPDNKEEGAQAFHNLCHEKSFRCQIESKERVPGATHTERIHSVILDILDASGSLSPQNKSVNETLVAEGFAMVDRKSTTRIKAELLSAQATAKKQRLRIWQLGDGVEQSDDDHI